MICLTDWFRTFSTFLFLRLSGGELFDRLVQQDYEFTEADCISYMRQICQGVKHMHQNNIVHLDLKVGRHAWCNVCSGRIRKTRLAEKSLYYTVCLYFSLQLKKIIMSLSLSLRTSCARPRTARTWRSSTSVSPSASRRGSKSRCCLERQSSAPLRSSTTNQSPSPPTCGRSESCHMSCKLAVSETASPSF